jgi:cytochrome c-type biogenesis protein CcmH/NrfG
MPVSPTAQIRINPLVFRGAFVMAFLCLLTGLAFCLLVPPHMMAAKHRAAGVAALSTARLADAESSLRLSLRKDPLSVEGWKILARILEQKGEVRNAQRALAVVAILEEGPAGVTPVYAMPAELKLSLLAMAASDVR